MTGTVFDIGYRNYTGVREGKNRSHVAVFKDGVRTALGLGRSSRTKLLPWGFIALIAFIGIVMTLIAGAALKMGGPEAAARLPSHSDMYGILSIIVFVFAAVVAPELLCQDRREGTLNLYLVRPLTGSDYVLARWTAFLVVLMVATWLPQMILFIGMTMAGPDPLAYLRNHWLDVPRFIGAGAAMAAYTTSLAMFVASFTTRRAYASVFLVGLFIVSTPFTAGLSTEIDGAAGAWMSMFNLTNIPVHVNDIIFGEASEITAEAPARELGATTLVVWYFAWTLIPAAILWRRYRRMSP